MSVKMTHPDGGELDARPDQVEMYESQGWQSDEKPADTKKK